MRGLPVGAFYVATIAFSMFFLMSQLAFAGGEIHPWNKKLATKLTAMRVSKVDFEKAKPLVVFKHLRKISKSLASDGRSVNFIFKNMDRRHALITIKSRIFHCRT